MEEVMPQSSQLAYVQIYFLLLIRRN